MGKKRPSVLWLLAAICAGCNGLPPMRPAPLDTAFEPVARGLEALPPPGADGGRTVLLSLALRQEMRPGSRRGRWLVNHVDLLAGDRAMGFYNTRARPAGWRRAARLYAGAYRDRAWLEANRPYYLDAGQARRASVRGREVKIMTVWVGTRVTPQEAARVQEAMDRRSGHAAPYHLLEHNCASRLAGLLAEAGWLPRAPGRGALPGLDRPALLVRRFVERAGPGQAWTARGFLDAGADGTVVLRCE